MAAMEGRSGAAISFSSCARFSKWSASRMAGSSSPFCEVAPKTASPFDSGSR
jgi:hypothetical protein